MSEILKGKVATMRIAKESEKWATYEVAFSDGGTAKVVHAKDREPLRIGDTIECAVSSFGGWRTTSIHSENGSSNGNGERAERPHREEGEKKSYTQNKPTANDREGYWEKRFAYEVGEMYPKIEFQAISAMVVSIYAAAMPYLETPPTNPDEVNAYIQMALDKGRSVFNEINTKG